MTQYIRTRVDLGARRSVVDIFTDSVTTIKQLLKGKDGIVMERSLYCLINNLWANYWALIIRNKSAFIIIFSLPNCSLEVFFWVQVQARVRTHYKTYSIELEHLASGILLLVCQCDVAFNLYHMMRWKIIGCSHICNNILCYTRWKFYCAKLK